MARKFTGKDYKKILIRILIEQKYIMTFKTRTKQLMGYTQQIDSVKLEYKTNDGSKTKMIA